MIFPGWTLADYWRAARRWRSYWLQELEGWPYNSAWSCDQYTTNSCAPTLLKWPLRDLPGGWTSMLHKWVGVDQDEPFHTHQAAIGARLVLAGGYVEEVRRRSGRVELVEWRAGQFGLITGGYSHRLVQLIDGLPAVTLFVRGPTTRPVELWWPDGRRIVYPVEEMR